MTDRSPARPEFVHAVVATTGFGEIGRAHV